MRSVGSGTWGMTDVLPHSTTQSGSPARVLWAQVLSSTEVTTSSTESLFITLGEQKEECPSHRAAPCSEHTRVSVSTMVTVVTAQTREGDRSPPRPRFRLQPLAGDSAVSAQSPRMAVTCGVEGQSERKDVLALTEAGSLAWCVLGVTDDQPGQFPFSPATPNDLMQRGLGQGWRRPSVNYPAAGKAAGRRNVMPFPGRVGGGGRQPRAGEGPRPGVRPAGLALSWLRRRQTALLGLPKETGDGYGVTV